MGFKLSDKQLLLLDTSIREGGISSRHSKEHYNDNGNFYRGLHDLEQKGLLERKAAPERAPQEYVWFPTQLGRKLTQVAGINES